MGPLGSTGDDTSCVIDDMTSSFPQLVDCEKFSNMGQKTWNFVQVNLQTWTNHFSVHQSLLKSKIQENGKMYFE